MKIKQISQYLISFISIVLVIYALFSHYKKSHEKEVLRQTVLNVKKEYKESIEKQNTLVKLIFSNSVLYDKNIIEILKTIDKNDSLSKEKSRENLYSYLKNTYYYFESYGIEHINFYLPNNEVFLKMQNIEDNSYKSKQSSVIFVNSEKKDFQGFEIDDCGLHLKFIKAIYDEELNYLGSIEVKISPDNVTQNIEKSLGSKEFILFESEDDTKKSFLINKAFKIEASTYSSWRYKYEILSTLTQKNKNYVNRQMSLQNDFYVIFERNDKKLIAVFTKIPNILDETKQIYLLSIKEEINISFFLPNILFVLLALSILVITCLIFILKNRKSKEYVVRKRYLDLLKAIDKYVIMLESDKYGIITSVTKAFCDVSGYTKKELVGKSINILRHPDMSENFFKRMWSDLKQGKVWKGEIKNLDKNGNTYWVRGTIFPNYDDKKNIIGYTSIRVSITNTKQLKKINNLLKNDLSKKLTEIRVLDKNQIDNAKLQLMSKVLDSTAYQWRNPISRISLHLADIKSLLETNEINQENLNELHDLMDTELRALSYSLNDFKSLFDGTKKDSRYNVFEVLKETKNGLSNELKKANVKVNIICSNDIYCFGIFNDLKQTMSNLLKDSIYNLTNEESSFVSISVIKDEDSVLIKYQDNVKNFSNSKIEEIFNKENEEYVHTKKDLNLYIVKLLTEKIGANIISECDSSSRTFYLKLIFKDRRQERR